MNENDRRYYIDYSRDGGVVHSQPVKKVESFIPELVLDTKSRAAIDFGVRDYSEMLKRLIPEAAKVGNSARKTVTIVESRLQTLGMSEPGLLDIGDNYYYGWFRWMDVKTGDEGTIFSKKEPRKWPSEITYFSPYLKLSEGEAQMWDKKAKQAPLSVDEVRDLSLSENASKHPLFGKLEGLSVDKFYTHIRANLDQFWDEFRLVEDDGTKFNFLKDWILRIKIYNLVSKPSYNRIISEVGLQMVGARISTMPTGDGAIVAFQTKSGESKFRSLPIPRDKIRIFQRYPVLGDDPLTETEVVNLYKSFVDPLTHLFD